MSLLHFHNNYQLQTNNTLNFPMSGSSEGTVAVLKSEKISASASEKEDGAITHAMKAALGTPERLVGRIVTINDGVSGIAPHAFVNIDSYEPSTETFAVRNLSCAIESEISSQVKLEHLDYDSHPDYCTQYPQASTVKGCCDSWSFPKETIVDFTEAWVRTDFPHPDIKILHSCRTFGAHKPSLMKLGYTEVSNHCIPIKLLVETKYDTDVIEFENLLFMLGEQKAECRIRCNRGITIFRNCTFHGGGISVIVGSVDPSVRVRFENCCFHHQVGCAVLINTGHVTMLQCTILQGSIGICVRGTGVLSVHHSNISNVTCGMLVAQKAQATIRNCTIKNVKNSGINVAKGGTANIHQCTIGNSECDGIIIEGGDKERRTAALIQDCDISCCFANGIRIGFGVVDAEIVRTNIDSNGTFGIYVSPSAIGSVIISDGIPEVGAYYLVDVSGDKCYVCVDGTLNPPGEQLANMQKVRKSLADTEFYLQAAEKLDMRAFSALRILNIPCQNCQLVEFGNEKYKLCSQCKRAHYCSRACQKEHWKKHKKECFEEVRMRQEETTQGYITCLQCNVAHLGANHGSGRVTVCRICFEAFYCIKHCKDAHWPVHRLHCKPYKKV